MSENLGPNGNYKSLMTSRVLELAKLLKANGLVWYPKLGDQYLYLVDEIVYVITGETLHSETFEEALEEGTVVWLPSIEQILQELEYLKFKLVLWKESEIIESQEAEGEFKDLVTIPTAMVWARKEVEQGEPIIFQLEMNIMETNYTVKNALEALYVMLLQALKHHFNQLRKEMKREE